jgi:hypothetical protein
VAARRDASCHRSRYRTGPRRVRSTRPSGEPVRIYCDEQRGAFAYIDGELPDGEVLPLMRLRYAGSASTRGFALHLASTNKYEDSILPTGSFTGTPEDALDCACRLYLAADSF